MEAREGGAEKVVSPIPVFLIAFVAIMGGALLGITLRRFLPGHHLAEDSKDFVRLGTGLIGTMAALVLGLLIASAKSSTIPGALKSSI